MLALKKPRLGNPLRQRVVLQRSRYLIRQSVIDLSCRVIQQKFSNPLGFFRRQLRILPEMIGQPGHNFLPRTSRQESRLVGEVAAATILNVEMDNRRIGFR